MTIEMINKIFDGESGEKTVLLDCNSNNACIQAGFSVSSGAVRVVGKVSQEDDEHELGFIDLKTGEIKSYAEEGVYSLLGCEILYSVTFLAEENSVVTAKYLY